MLKKTRLYFTLKSIIAVLFITLLFDFIYTNINKNLFNFDFENSNSNIHGNFKNGIKEYYISPIYGKTLFCTDMNGFRNNCIKSVEKNFDYLLIGNIFTEGVYLNYKKTFAGIIEENNKRYKFANLGNRSLDIYGIEKKIKDILSNKYVKFKEVVIFIGPRLFQEKDKKIKTRKKNSVNSIKKKIMNNFYFFNNFYHWFLFKKDRMKIWAYSKNNHYTKKIVMSKNFINSLNNIHKILDKNDKFLSIVMYPYPNHFLYEDFEDQYIKNVKNFCEVKCNYFINTYDIFYSKMNRKDPWKFIDDIYLPYSVHFNKNGNKIIADSVNEIFRNN